MIRIGMFHRSMGLSLARIRTVRSYSYSKTRLSETIAELNNLQSNYQTILEQENIKIDPLTKFNHQKKILQQIDNGDLYERLRYKPIIHVAGTKGKGSTCAFIESILRHRGLKTGFFSSPHLVSATERIRIDYSPICTDLFIKYFWNIHDQLKSSERPAYFAFLTLVALEAFIKQDVDVIILEVGIGGRFCATNTYPPYDNNNLPGRISCITSLGYDHCSILGYTIEEIAENKCGIFHPFSTNFSSNQPISGAKTIIEKCSAQQSNSSIVYAEPGDFLCGLKLGLAGPFQVENAALAVKATRCFLNEKSKHPRGSLKEYEIEGLTKAKWPGRSQVVDHEVGSKKFKVLLDGAHTTESISGCVTWVKSLNVQNLSIIFNITGKRDEAPLLEILAELNPQRIFLTPNVPGRTSASARPDQENRNNPLSLQTARLKQIQATIHSMDIESIICDSVTDVFSEKTLSETVLITGSIHLLGAFFQLRPDIVL